MAYDVLLTLENETPIPPPFRSCRACMKVSRHHTTACLGCGSDDLVLWADEQHPMGSLKRRAKAYEQDSASRIKTAVHIALSAHAIFWAAPTPAWAGLARHVAQGQARPNHADRPAALHPGYCRKEAY